MISCDHIYEVLIDYLESLNLEEVVVVSDVGGVARARAFASNKDAPLAIIDKRRSAHNIAESLTVIEVKGKTAILIDDMMTQEAQYVQG